MVEDNLNVYQRETECDYKEEHYLVRDNGSVLRKSRPGKKTRKDDNVWTFGSPGNGNYLYLSGVQIHRIVATAFLGLPPTPQHIVDHINTNRHDNRPENLRWVTRFDNMVLNETTRKKLELICGMPIEEILKDISILRTKVLPSNMLWMKTVTAEEAQQTKESWEKWIKEVPNRPTSMRKPGWVKLNGKWYIPSYQERNAVTSISGVNIKAQYAYPCCPQKPSETPLQDYLKALKPGVTCLKIKDNSGEFEIKLDKAALNPRKDEIIVISESGDAIYIQYSDGIFFHKHDRLYPYHKGFCEYYFPWETENNH